MASWDFHTTGIVEWLEEYDGPRFHAILSDPPYALISIAKRFGPGQAPAQEGEDGRYSRLSKGFMGQTWDGFDSLESYQDWIGIWSKLLIDKALYPGAVALFFGGTRTFHHLGVGLEHGGFEIVDSILIPWLHGQGFPKSHDISKGLDKAAGAEREVVGTKKRRDIRNLKSKKARASGVSASMRGDPEYVDLDITLPATPDAEDWEGYGTALKPAWEPVFVCRAPRGDRTFAELAVQYGTGALNIDGARVAGSVPQVTQGKSGHIYGGGKGYAPGGHQLSNPHDSGRWPANLMLTHHEDCIVIGETLQPAKEIRENTEGTEGSFGLGSRKKPKSHYRIRGRQINRFKQGMMPFGGAEGEEYETEQMPDELVERWACVRECPVRVLDDQVGNLGLSAGVGSYAGKNRVYSERSGEKGDDVIGFGDTGGPSRFFYTAKASRSEKDKGLENFYWKRTKDGNWERISEEEWAKTDRALRGRGCIHPTVKPLALLRYLATLVLPPSRDEKRRLLVPFSGSGSEMIAAVQAGWDRVEGVEMADVYVEMAEARIRATIGML